MTDNMEPEAQLRDLGMLLRKDFGNEVRVDSFTIEFLTKPGENYGSTMLKVDAVVRKNATSKPENLHAVAKTVPSSEFFKEMFNSPVTFRKEIAMYEEIIPAYKQLQKENHVDDGNLFDILPYCYGTRMTLSTEVDFDDDAAILMENMRLASYSCGDRREGLDLTHCKLVISNMAKFHALGIAMKMKKPESFEKLRALAVAVLPPADMIDNVCIEFKKTVMKNPKLIKHWPRMEKVMKNIMGSYINLPEEPFATLCHMDLWVNNMMFHYNTDGQPDKMKFVDFQLYRYQSPIRDVIFFLVASSNNYVRKKHIDDLINDYYDNFVEALKEVNCDVSDFSRDKFDQEILKWSHAVFIQTTYMLKIILLPDNQTKSNSEIDSEFFEAIECDDYAKRMEETIDLFLSKGWI